MQCHQELSPQDKDPRLLFRRRIKNMSSANQIMFKNIIFSDEGHTYLKVMPNRRNLLSTTPPN